MSQADHREVLATVDRRGNRQWVYAAFARGRFRKYRTWVTGLLFVFYLVMPWIRINGEQGILLDFLSRKFVFFGTSFFATETIYLFYGFAFLALLLFFVTAIWGRIWCGWACPETVFLEFLFRPIERWIEGDHLARRRLDQSPWSFQKIQKKALKHFIFAFCAWVISSTFLAYFVGQEVLLQMMLAPPWENWPTFLTTLFLMFLMAFQFGWFREQFCTLLCPYARFQSVLLDRDSMVVTYDVHRGEPRTKIQKSRDSNQTGDCIDCLRCVRVCPTGIDIRNGLQLECIQCAACIDACDSVMSKLRRPTGLIRNMSDREMHHKKPKLLRPRVIIYGVILVFLTGFMGSQLLLRKTSDIQIYRQSGAVPFSLQAGGLVTNQVWVAISNRLNREQQYQIRSLNPKVNAIVPVNPYPVPAGQTAKIPVFLNFEQALLYDKKVNLQLEVTGESQSEMLKIELLGPERKSP